MKNFREEVKKFVQDGMRTITEQNQNQMMQDILYKMKPLLTNIDNRSSEYRHEESETLLIT